MKNEKFENDIITVPVTFNKLAIVELDGEKILKGELDIVDANGKHWDTYQIEIKGSDSYPFSFPKLFETADAFPKIVDWHVYEFDDKSCCVDILPSEKLLCKNTLHVTDYIHGHAIPYFANQSFRKREGYYLYGEYSHGVFGKIEYYQSKLKATSPQQLLQMLDFIIRGFHLERTAMCPFCHKVKFRHCHRAVFNELAAIKDVLMFDVLKQLFPFFQAHPNYQLPKVR